MATARGSRRRSEGDRVGRGLLALLVLAVMPRHGAWAASASTVLPSGVIKNRGHQAERAIALRDGVGLHIAV